MRTAPRQHACFCWQQLRLWVGWLFAVVLVPLLRTCFYVTESEHYRCQIFYYRYACVLPQLGLLALVFGCFELRVHAYTCP